MMQWLPRLTRNLCQNVLRLGWVVVLASLLGAGLPWTQPSYAAVSDQGGVREPINVLEYTQEPANREEAYEQAAEVAETPEKVLEAEDKEIEAYQASKSNKGLIEEAQELIEKVTGNQ